VSHSESIPETEPTELVAGASWEWKRTDLTTDFPASEWTLTYYYLLETGTTNFSIEADADGEYFSVDVLPATTANYTPGKYQWQAFATKDSEKFLIDRGCLDVLQDFSSDTTDPRTHNQKMFDLLKTVVEGKATRDIMKTEINGKKVERMSWAEVMEAYTHFKNLAKNECLMASNTENPNAAAEVRMIRHTFGNPE